MAETTNDQEILRTAIRLLSEMAVDEERRNALMNGGLRTALSELIDRDPTEENWMKADYRLIVTNLAALYKQFGDPSQVPTDKLSELFWIFLIREGGVEEPVDRNSIQFVESVGKLKCTRKENENETGFDAFGDKGAEGLALFNLMVATRPYRREDRPLFDQQLSANGFKKTKGILEKTVRTEEKQSHGYGRFDLAKYYLADVLDLDRRIASLAIKWLISGTGLKIDESTESNTQLPQSPTHEMLRQIHALGGAAAVLEMSTRVLMDKFNETSKAAQSKNVSEAETALVEKFSAEQKLSPEEAELLIAARGIRNKFLHGEFRTAVERLEKYTNKPFMPHHVTVGSLPGSDDGQVILNAVLGMIGDPSQRKSVIQAQGLDDRLFGWLIGISSNGALIEATDIIERAVGIVKRLQFS